jgi:hypothetical protein
LPSAEINTWPWPEAKWSKRPFTPSIGTEPDKMSGLAPSLAALFGLPAELFVAGFGVFFASCWALTTVTNATLNTSARLKPQTFFILSSVIVEMSRTYTANHPLNATGMVLFSPQA